MKAYVSLFCLRIKIGLGRWPLALAGALTQIFFGMLITSALKVLYLGSMSAEPFDARQAVSYVWLSQAFFGLLPWRADPELKNAIKSGDIRFDLLRPVDLYAWWFTRALGDKVAALTQRAIPIVVTGLLIGDIQLPHSMLNATAWAIGTLAALIFAGSCSVLISIANFHLMSAESLEIVSPVIFSAFSGLLVPLPLYPPAIQTLANLLPFRSLIDTPNRLWLGGSSVATIATLLLSQWWWIAVTVTLGRHCQTTALKSSSIQGG